MSEDTDSRLDGGSTLVSEMIEGSVRFHNETGQSGVLLERAPDLDELEWLASMAELTGPQ